MKWSRKVVDGIAYYHPAVHLENTDNNAMPIVFIHGVGLRAESWHKQLSVFSKNYRCYAIDMPGHGDSELLAQSTLQLSDFAQAVAHFIEQVIAEPAVIVGHSLGAMTALQTAISYPQVVRGIAAFNAIYDRPNTAAQAVQERAASLLQDVEQNLEQNVADSPISRWFDETQQNCEDAKLCRTCLNESNRLGYARAYSMFAHLRGISATDLATIDVPSLLLTGECDFNSSAQMSQAMANILPNAKAVIVPESRHMTPLTHADTVNTALEAFLSTCQSQAENSPTSTPNIHS